MWRNEGYKWMSTSDHNNEKSSMAYFHTTLGGNYIFVPTSQYRIQTTYRFI